MQCTSMGSQSPTPSALALTSHGSTLCSMVRRAPPKHSMAWRTVSLCIYGFVGAPCSDVHTYLKQTVAKVLYILGRSHGQHRISDEFTRSLHQGYVGVALGGSMWAI